MPKNRQSNLIASVKTPNIGFIYEYIINLGIREGGYSVIVNYQLLLSNIFPLAPPKLFFFITYRRNRLLRVSFIE